MLQKSKPKSRVLEKKKDADEEGFDYLNKMTTDDELNAFGQDLA